MPIKVIMKSVYGSHLYGTSTPTSDMDYKQIHMNPLDLILIGKDKGCFNQNTNNSGRNTKDDVDFESKELRTFIWSALEGQTFAIEMLFTPDHLILETSDIWEEIRSLRDSLVTRNVKPIVGYVASMSSKYSNKGVKYNELKNIIEILENVNQRYTFKDFMESEYAIDFSGYKYCKSFEKKLNSGDMQNSEKYVELTSAQFPYSRKIHEILPVIKDIFETYGDRVKNSAINTNQTDYKSLMHALRLTWELREYLTTKMLKFPLDRANDLKDVRLGKYSREYVEQWISSEIEDVLKIPNELPEPNYNLWNNWLLDKYMLQAHEQSSEYIKSRQLL